MRVPLAFLGVFGVTAVACGLSVVGESSRVSASNDASALEADETGAGSNGEQPPPDCQTDACVLPAEPGFSLALFGNATQGCPQYFVATDVDENPVVGANACTCGACSAQINCSTGTLSTSYGNMTCNVSGAPLPTNDGACRNATGQWGENASVDPPSPVVGTCSAIGVPSRAEVTTSAMRICLPGPSACNALACSPPAGMALCMVKDGDTECPASAPNKHLVGADFALTCGSCPCSLDVKCSGKAESFPLQNCQGTPTSVTAGVCTNTNGTNFASTKWTGTVASQQCTPGAPPPPAVSLTNVRTVCCL